MAGRVEGKVALVTGAARGQGKSHCIRLAEEGATIIAVDLLEQIDSVAYPLGSEEDMADTVAKVEATGQKVLAKKADVRERGQLRAAVAEGVEAFGGLDIVCANAGILPVKQPFSAQHFVDAVDVDFGGVMNAVAVALPHLKEGASIILTGSTAGMIPKTLTNPALGPGSVGYGLAKTFIIQYCETLALQLAPQSIRVNAVHPTNVNTNLLHNDELYRVFRPDVENPGRDDVLPAFYEYHGMPIPYVEPRDISNAVLFLASDEARYITGTTCVSTPPRCSNGRTARAGDALKRPRRRDRLGATRCPHGLTGSEHRRRTSSPLSACSLDPFARTACRHGRMPRCSIAA